MRKIDFDERIKIHDLVLEDIDQPRRRRLTAHREPKGRKKQNYGPAMSQLFDDLAGFGERRSLAWGPISETLSLGA
jgi:hypothetical protein